MPALNDYEVTEPRFIGGQHRKKGDLVPMTPRAAKYYMEPHGTGLKVPEPRKEPVVGLDDPKIKKPTEQATAKPGK